MPDYLVLKKIRLTAANAPTGMTRHLHGKTELPAPVELQIVKYPDDAGYYLLYLDDSGNEQTDTYHDTLEGALSQAEFEFKTRPGDWETPVV